MRAFVAGATGYTGKAVVRELRRRGIATFAHVRRDSAGRDAAVRFFQEVGAEPRVTEWTLVEVEGALEQARPDLVFALLGTTRKRARREGISGDVYQKVEGKLSTMLLDATQRAAPSARFTFLSAIGTRPRSRNQYLAARAVVEDAVMASGVAYTIARPGLITGKDREESRPLERFAAGLMRAAITIGGAFGRKGFALRFAPLNSTELARALVSAAIDPACQNRVLEVADLRSRSEAGS
jgi:uncharacterized protein YbjT (DUF2867 family)